MNHVYTTLIAWKSCTTWIIAKCSFFYFINLIAEYIKDVELMFSNCLEYNPINTNEAKAGLRLQAFFHSELQRLGLAERMTPPQKRPRM